MTANTTLNTGTGGDSIRTIDRSGSGPKTQVVQVDVGGGGATEALLAPGQATKAASLPVVIASDQGALATSLGSGVVTDLGAQADAAATTDAGTFSLIALIKRALGNWTTLLARIPPLGQASMANSLSVAISSNQSVVPISTMQTGANYTLAGVITINTILQTVDCSTTSAGALSIQCISMGTTGVVTPEWSNDNTTWIAGTLLTPAGATAATFNAAGLWTTPVIARYLRLRLSTATTAGTTTIQTQAIAEAVGAVQAQPVIVSSGTVTTVSTVSNVAAIAAGTAAIGDTGVQYRANATGAASITSVLSPATPAGASIKGSAGRLVGWTLQNSSAGVRSVKVYNATTVTMGTTAAAFEIDIPAGGFAQLSLDGGIGFATGIMWAVTSAKGLTDNTTTGLAVNDVTGAFFYA